MPDLTQILDSNLSPPVSDKSEVDKPEEGTDPYELNDDNKRKVNERVKKKLEADRFARYLFERIWFRNILFAAGVHQAIFDNGKWRTRRLPAWYPRAQTNKFAEKNRDLVSAIMQGRVPIRYLPATDSPDDSSTAEVGERVREVMYAEARIDEKEAEAANWYTLTGNFFILPYYDYDEKYGSASHPKLECPMGPHTFSAQDVVDQEIDTQAPMCPEHGAPLQPSQETELLPIGALCVDIEGPFAIRCDHRIRDYKDWTWFARMRRYDTKFVTEKWKYKPPSDDDTTMDAEGSLSQYYLDILAQITDSWNPMQSGLTSGAAGGAKIPKVTAYEYYELPSDDYPEGLKAIQIGKEQDGVVEIGPLPTQYGAGIRKGQKFLPIAHGKAETIPGRLWGKTPLDDAIPLQVFRNVVEACLRANIQRSANTGWFNPRGSGVQQFTGEPGWICDYNPVSLGGTATAKPERMEANLSFVGFLIELLKYIDDTIERVTGTYFLQGGDAPQGVTAAAALSLLDERAKKAMSPLTREWAKAFLAFEQMGLEIARENWTDQRIRIVAGRNKKWDTAKFMNSDLQGAVNMEVDYQSLFPKSNATEVQETIQLIQGGVLSPQDPQQRVQILKKFGKLDMLGSIDLDIKQAQREWDDFYKWCKLGGTIQPGADGSPIPTETKEGKPPQLRPAIQNSMIHYLEHCDSTKTDEYEELTPEQQQIWEAHIQATMVDIGERRALFMQMQINPDDPMTMEIGTPEAQAALQGGQKVMGPQMGQPGSTAGAQAGAQGPRRPGAGTTGNGPNQMQAQIARAAGGAPKPPDIGAAVNPGG